MKNKWLTKKTITKTIDDQEVVFRKIPVGTLQKCRGLEDGIAKFLGMLLKNTDNDVEREGLQDTSGNSSWKTSAAQGHIIEMRAAQLENGIKGLMSVVTSDESMLLLSEVIVKSAYEEFEDADIPTLKDSMGIDTMIEFLKGALEASAGDYALLGKSLFQKHPKVQEVLEAMKAQ